MASVDWECCKTDEGEEYFVNNKTEETSWDEPENCWIQHTDEEGAHYYAHSGTGETSWDPPSATGAEAAANDDGPDDKGGGSSDGKIYVWGI